VSLCVQIFFSEMKYTHVESEAAYTVLTLLCDIGGSLGLIIGSTMLTVCEFADFFIKLAVDSIRLRASIADGGGPAEQHS